MVNTYILQGTARWAKIVGEPHPGFDEGTKEWSFDLVLDEKGKAEFLASGADKFYLRNKDGVDYVKFVRKATKSDGSPSKPISIEDDHGNPWGDKLIGNGSVLNVKYSLNEVKSRGQKRLKPSVIAVQVWDHSPYVPKSSFKTRESSTQVEAASADSEW